MAFHLLAIGGAIALKAIAAKVGTAIVVKSGAAAVGKAAAASAIKAGATKAAAASVAKLATGATLAAEAGTATVAVSAAIKAHAHTQGEQARSLFAETRELLQRAKTTVEEEYRRTVTARDDTLHCIGSEAQPVLQRFGTQAGQVDGSALPGVQALVRDISHLPEVPRMLAPTIPDPPSILRSEIRFTPQETRAIHYASTHDHPLLGATVFFGKIYGRWLGDSLSYWDAVSKEKAEAEVGKAHIEKACRGLLEGHRAACKAVEEHCAQAVEVFRLHAMPGLAVANSGKTWEELSASEQEAIITLKQAHDLLLPRLSDLVETASVESRA